MDNKSKLWLFLVSLLVCLGVIIGFHLAQCYYDDLEARLILVENKYNSGLTLGQQVSVDDLKIFITKSVESVKDQYKIWLLAGLPLTISAILVSIFWAYRWAAEIAREEIKESFKDIETLLKERKRILVISEDPKSEDWMRKFLLKTQFRKVTFRTRDERHDIGPNDCDLVLIHDRKLEITVINKLLEDLEDYSAVFYFGKGVVENERLGNEGRLSFASASSQLYGNLINALKYQNFNS